MDDALLVYNIRGMRHWTCCKPDNDQRQRQDWQPWDDFRNIVNISKDPMIIPSLLAWQWVIHGIRDVIYLANYSLLWQYTWDNYGIFWKSASMLILLHLSVSQAGNVSVLVRLHDNATEVTMGSQYIDMNPVWLYCFSASILCCYLNGTSKNKRSIALPPIKHSAGDG